MMLTLTKSLYFWFHCAFNINLKKIQIMFVSLKSNTTGVIGGAETATLPKHLRSSQLVLLELLFLSTIVFFLAHPRSLCSSYFCRTLLFLAHSRSLCSSYFFSTIVFLVHPQLVMLKLFFVHHCFSSSHPLMLLKLFFCRQLFA